MGNPARRLSWFKVARARCQCCSCSPLSVLLQLPLLRLMPVLLPALSNHGYRNYRNSGAFPDMTLGTFCHTCRSTSKSSQRIDADWVPFYEYFDGNEDGTEIHPRRTGLPYVTLWHAVKLDSGNIQAGELARVDCPSPSARDRQPTTCVT